MTPVAAVVCDLDGTLIDSDEALLEPFLAAGVPREAVRFGLPVEPDVSIRSGSGLSASSHRDSCLIATEGSSEGRRKLTRTTLVALRP